jgi:hypothetical protein
MKVTKLRCLRSHPMNSWRNTAVFPLWDGSIFRRYRLKMGSPMWPSSSFESREGPSARHRTTSARAPQDPGRLRMRTEGTPARRNTDQPALILRRSGASLEGRGRPRRRPARVLSLFSTFPPAAIRLEPWRNRVDGAASFLVQSPRALTLGGAARAAPPPDGTAHGIDSAHGEEHPA